MKLSQLIEDFKKDNSQKNYESILTELFTKCENTNLWLEAKTIENGWVYRGVPDENGNEYVVAYTDESIRKSNLDNRTDMLAHITVKGIFELILSNECHGLIIDLDDSSNQFVLPKDYIIKIFNAC